jgi:two-component system phosphate regulon sensor histidine kinase PhoR
MKSKTIRWIIAFSTISLIGLIATQLYWINNALKLGEEQFTSRVTIALQGALDEYVQVKRGEPCEVNCGCLQTPIAADSLFVNLDPLKMDSILKIHFTYHGLPSDFGLRVVKCATAEVLYEKVVPGKSKGYTSRHQISLSCLKHQESHRMEVDFGRSRKVILSDLLVWLASSTIFLLVLVLCFTFILFAIVRQKKISEIRNDFINNMTHEFKTPIANISLACDVLRRPDAIKDQERIGKYVTIVNEENQRMRSLVDRVLQFALWNQEKPHIDRIPSDLNELIRDAVDHICLEDCKPGARIGLDLCDERHEIEVDPVHFTNIIHNLIDNAQKYSVSDPLITITTRISHKEFTIEVKDNGIGITPKAQKHIFEKFYRVPTGNLHDVKGSGLGLYYVKTMVEIHGGSIRVKSEPGKGSRFIINLPR